MWPVQVNHLIARNCCFQQLERRIKYLNNIIEQDHRFIKKLVKAGMYFKSFISAKNTLAGYEAIHMIRKKQITISKINKNVNCLDLIKSKLIFFKNKAKIAV